MSTDPTSTQATSADLAYAAAHAPILTRAEQLAEWVGDGKPVTAKGVLRRADAIVIAKELGIDLPRWVRSTTEFDEIHRVLLVAQSAGLITVGRTRAKRVVDGAITEPGSTLLAGLSAVLRDMSVDRYRRGAEILCRNALSVLAAEPPPSFQALVPTLMDTIRWRQFDDASDAFDQYGVPVLEIGDTLILFNEFGFTDDQERITPLGRWVLRELDARAPKLITRAVD